MTGKYILQGHKAVPCHDLMVWAKWFETSDRRVELTAIDSDVYISTVFLGLDHQFGHGEPLLFETMIFGGPHDGYSDRYSSWSEAVDGHARAVELVKGTTEHTSVYD